MDPGTHSEIRALEQGASDLPQQLLIECVFAAEPDDGMDGAPTGLQGGLATHLPPAGPPPLQDLELDKQDRQGAVRLIPALPQARLHLPRVAAAIRTERKLP